MFSRTPSDSCYENPSSNSCFLMNFPSSLLNDSELLFDQLLHHQSPPYDSINNTHNPISIISMDSSKDHIQKEKELGHEITTTTTKTATKAGLPEKRKRVAGAGALRRRTGKKDRHSKIYTAQGPRDRRMRLSLQIARKFFDLQDVLGFDKASKTIEWLFSKSKPAIKELTSSLPPHQRKGSLVISHSNNNNSNKVNLEDLVRVNEPKITGINSKPVARESREKARARARQRTIEKKKQKELLMLEINPTYNNNYNNIGSSSTPDEEELNSTTLEAMDFHSQPQQSPLENQMSCSVSIIEQLLGSDSSASSSSIYDECSHLGFNGNWVSESLRMYPSYGVDELQVILQQQNPNPISSQSASGMQFQSP